MIYFVIRVLVNALALAVTILLTPRLNVQPLLPPVIPLGSTYLILGVLVGVVNAVVRPLVLLFTARLLVRNIGLFALLINGFLFGLLYLLVPYAFVIGQPVLFWIIFASLVMAVIVAVMEALFGLDRPQLSQKPEEQFYWRWVRLLSAGRRNAIAENLRVMQITDIVTRYTKDIAVDMSPLARFRLFMQELLYRDVDPITTMSTPAKVRYMLQDLGPTFVKFGQIVSSRAEQVPPEWRTELEQLQSNVPPFSFATARKIVEDELDAPLEELFDAFEPEPFAAASTAQVHRAVLPDGTTVAFKIQRPNIDVTVKADLNVMRDLTTSISRKREWARDLNLRGLVNDFADNILYELDYRNEANNARLLAHNMAVFERVKVPRVYGAYTTAKVMAQEFVTGVKITNVAALDAAGIDRIELARLFVRAMIKQALFDGFFHADPHPGNVLVNLETGNIIFLDMGLMGEMNREQRMALGDLLWSIGEQDGYSLGRALLRLSRPFRQVDEKRFLEQMESFGRRYLEVEGGDLSLVFGSVQDVMRRSGLRLDPQLTLVIKTLMQAEEIARALDPSINITAAATADTVTLARTQLNSDALTKTLRLQVARSAREVMYRVPDLVDATTKWLDQYQSGRLNVYVDTSDLGKQVTKLDDALNRAVNRLVIGLVLVGWIVGSAIATTIGGEVAGVSLATIAFYMFALGAIVGAYIVVRALVNAWRKQEDDELF